MSDPFGGYTTNSILKEYVRAHKNAPKGHESDANQRMFHIRLVDEAILHIGDRPDAPQELKDFIAAEADKGCMSCWLSSVKRNNHPDCEMKINRWFECRKKLLNYK